MKQKSFFAVTIIALLLVACENPVSTDTVSDSPVLNKNARTYLPEGLWYGFAESIGMKLNVDGENSTFLLNGTGANSAYGTIDDKKIQLDKNGQFKAHGTLVTREHRAGVKIILTGTVRADRMWLTITIEKEKEAVGNYKLIYHTKI